MAVPFILWGAAAGLAALGVKKGIDASEDFSRAKYIGEMSEKKYKRISAALEKDREDTQVVLQELGRLKVAVFTNQIKHLVDVIKKSKNAKSILKNYQADFSVDQIKEYESLVLKSLEIEKGVATGAVGGALAAMGAYGAVGTLATASTGAAISGLSGVAATNATLAWLGGGALSAGGFGMAGGMIALGGIVLGPALAIGGFMMASKAEEALTAARRYEAEVDEATEKMKATAVVLKGIRTNAAELSEMINRLSARFDVIKVRDDSNLAAFEQMLVFGKSLKALLDVPIIEKDGTPVEGLRAQCAGHMEIC